MRAIRCHGHGEPEGLVLEEVASPGEPGPGQLVVAVEAAAVNYPDALIVQNRYQISIPPPFTPGTDFAGTIRAVGAEVDGLTPGERVFGAAFGAFAEEVVVPADRVRRVPSGVDAGDAAAFATVYDTAYDALRSTAGLRAGETLVVLGAAGGVGSAAVQIGALLGARVIACGSSDEKLGVARALGAAEVVRYDRPGFKEALKALAPGGVDVVLDPVGGAYAESALRAVTYGGRFVVVGFASGEIPRIPLNLVLLKGVVVKGYEIASFLRNEPDAAQRNRRELLGHLRTGRLRPHVSRRIALAEVPAALRDALARRVVGKIVVDVRR
jgi:NADPH2:quinone reductase